MSLLTILLAASIYVNPFIGASTSIGAAGIYHGLGKTYPGATTPFGMVQANPTTITGGDNAPGYSYEHTTIEGFAMTQISGTGWFGEMGNFLTMPTTGSLKLQAGKEGDTSVDGWRSSFDKSTEKASAGYYSVVLSDYGIQTECSATPHCGILRFTYPQCDTSRIQIDLARRVAGRSTEQYLEVVDKYTIRGWMNCPWEGGGWGHGDGRVSYVLYFYATFSEPLKNYGFWENGKVVKGKKSLKGGTMGFFTEFATSAGKQVEMKVGLSYVDLNGAKKNYDAEIKKKDFDTVHNEAVALWDKALSVIEIETPDEDLKTIFYTALYHTMLDPRIISDVDGRYWGPDGVHKDGGFKKRTVFSGWDVFRSMIPLQTIINPELVDDLLNSLITMAEQSGRGYFERWELLNAYSGCMLGNPALSVLTDAYVKGIRGYDVQKAYEYAKKSSELFPGSYASISETLEYSYFDWCLSVLAQQLSKTEDAQYYLERSLRYRDIFNPDILWFQPKDTSGRWIPLPRDGRFTQNYGCMESNPYQQGWFVPHDWEHFVTMLGGEKAARSDLQSMFQNSPRDYSWNNYYNHANEPVHFVPFLFNKLGAPELTQYWTRDICENAYHNSVEGLVGNDDVGQMSAWYILASIGFHPVCPGTDSYELTSPMFDKVTINLPNGNKFVVRAEGNSRDSRYFSSVTLNGQPVTGTSITHSQITDGGELVFQMKK